MYCKLFTKALTHKFHFIYIYMDGRIAFVHDDQQSRSLLYVFHLFPEFAYFEECGFASSIPGNTKNPYNIASIIVAKPKAKIRIKAKLQHPANKRLSKSFPCGCGRKYSRLAHLTYHLKWECGKLQCPKCGKAFKNISTLRYHDVKCKYRVT